MNLILFAIAPVLAIIICIYFNDKYEKEPKRLLLYSFLLGVIYGKSQIFKKQDWFKFNRIVIGNTLSRLL